MIQFLNPPRRERETEREFLHLGPERESLSKEKKVPEILKMVPKEMEDTLISVVDIEDGTAYLPQRRDGFILTYLFHGTESFL